MTRLCVLILLQCQSGLLLGRSILTGLSINLSTLTWNHSSSSKNFYKSKMFDAVLRRLKNFPDWYYSSYWSFESKRQDERANVYRKQLWPDACGKILELGPGFASSLKLLPHKVTSDGEYLVDPDIVHSYVALEPNPFMYEKLQQNAQQNGFVVQYDETCLERKELATTGLVPFTIVRGTLDNSIPQTVLDNAPYDTVITSFSLCTAEDPATSLKNIVRLLKPGGTYIFIEHILHPPEDEPLLVDGKDVNAKFWRRMQKIANPLWRICGHGCEIIRETAKAIDNTPGWETVSYRYARISDNFLSYFVPMVFGKAIKR